MPRFDSIRHTASSEWSSRQNLKIGYLQVHHATTTNLSGLLSLMAPGGRTVSANGAMGNDGHLVEVVPTQYRAFTSASAFDRQSFTVECCNTSLAPTWGISDATHRRLAELAVDLHREFGMPLDRAHIIGHNEVPGTYATACPGPCMDLNRVVREANALLNGEMMGLNYEEDRWTLARILYYDVRDTDTGKGYVGRTNFDWHKRHEERREAINTRAEARHRETLDAIKSAAQVPVSLTDAQVKDMAAQVAAAVKIPAGASKADVAAAINESLARIFR